ncbi:MAG TPA: ABC transporter permease [Clostridiales bacterium]|jgi:peptide/nickel transport system permease protein|nr:ABC transporter permease [Clostridiales bacterium]
MMDKDRENRIDKKTEYTDIDNGLSDVQRVKVLSPGMLVVRRFLRNRLAIIGFVIITFMFLFSFLGGLLTPYGESQVFRYIGNMSKEYVSVTINNEFRYTVAEGMTYGNAAHARFILARNRGDSFFTHDGEEYRIIQEAEDFYRVVLTDPKAQITYIRGVMSLTPLEDGLVFEEELQMAIREAIDAEQTNFVIGGEQYTLTRQGRDYVLGTIKDVAIESLLIADGVSSNEDLGFEFKFLLEKTLKTGDSLSFSFEGDTYQIEEDENVASVYKIVGSEREQYALISQMAVRPISTDVILTIEFKTALEQAIVDGVTNFIYPDDSGNDVVYDITRINNVYTVKTETRTHLISMHEQPSSNHWLGTDKHGMDVLTRLMYGGRISLMIGFIVVLLETILGVIMGGLAGYFGKWVDMLIMRIVDVFFCIPFLPILIIIGSVMDKLDVDPQLRIYYLMLILGIMSWPGIARMVRGQILSLREQEFMLAAEATGLSISRRIFKHLVPNVIPQLIVLATLGLGGVILYESTLSFLGLGVKFPFASWGNIISGVTTAYEMTNFWFVWIPAGLLILLTVLGFNFVGDGLRDAFDPKMKR